MEKSLNTFNEKNYSTNITNSINNTPEFNVNKHIKRELSKDIISNNKRDISLDSLTSKSIEKINTNSNNNIENINNKYNIFKKGKKLSQTNLSYLNRFIDYEKKKIEKISEMKKEIDEKEKDLLQKKPIISRKSVELINRKFIKDTFFERMEEEDKKAKIKKQKLIEKINNERIQKKKESEKPLEFDIKPTTIDKRFKKIYQEMLKKNEDAKEKLNIFSDVVKQYEMRECSFQPNINKDEKNNKKKKEKKSLYEITHRLYDNNIKNKENVRENLEQKYKLSFKPKINGKSLEMIKNRKKRIENENKKIDKNIHNKLDSNNDKNKKINEKGKRFMNDINKQQDNKENIKNMDN